MKIIKYYIYSLCAILLGVVGFYFYVTNPTEPSAISILERGLLLAKQTDNYKAVFIKENIKKGKVESSETMLIKFKRPFKLYVKWIAGKNKDREVLYVEGENNNKLKVHLDGFLGLVMPSIDIALDDPKLKAESNRSIKDLSIENLMISLLEQYYLAEKDPRCVLRFNGYFKISKFETYRFERITPHVKEYFCYRAVIDLDKNTNLPVRVVLYDWNNILIARYTFQQIIMSADLTDFDFNFKNKDYKFTSLLGIL